MASAFQRPSQYEKRVETQQEPLTTAVLVFQASQIRRANLLCLNCNDKVSGTLPRMLLASHRASPAPVAELSPLLCSHHTYPIDHTRRNPLRDDFTRVIRNSQTTATDQSHGTFVRATQHPPSHPRGRPRPGGNKTGSASSTPVISTCLSNMSCLTTQGIHHQDPSHAQVTWHPNDGVSRSCPEAANARLISDLLSRHSNSQAPYVIPHNLHTYLNSYLSSQASSPPAPCTH